MKNTRIIKRVHGDGRITFHIQWMFWPWMPVLGRDWMESKSVFSTKEDALHYASPKRHIDEVVWIGKT